MYYRCSGADPKCCKSNLQFASSLELNGKIACEPRWRCVGNFFTPIVGDSYLRYTWIPYAYMVAKGNKLHLFHRQGRAGNGLYGVGIIWRKSAISGFLLRVQYGRDDSMLVEVGKTGRRIERKLTYLWKEKILT